MMTYTFPRIGAAVGMRVQDYYPQGKRFWVRLHEKGGKQHEMPVHHKLEVYLDEYIAAAGIADDEKGAPLPHRDRQDRHADDEPDAQDRRVSDDPPSHRRGGLQGQAGLPYLPRDRPYYKLSSGVCRDFGRRMDNHGKSNRRTADAV